MEFHSPEELVGGIVRMWARHVKGLHDDEPLIAVTVGTLAATKLTLMLHNAGSLDWIGDPSIYDRIENVGDELADRFYEETRTAFGEVPGVFGLAKGSRPSKSLHRGRHRFEWCTSPIRDDETVPMSLDMERLGTRFDEIRWSIIKFLGVASRRLESDNRTFELISQLAACIAVSKLVISMWGDDTRAALLEALAERIATHEYAELDKAKDGGRPPHMAAEKWGRVEARLKEIQDRIHLVDLERIVVPVMKSDDDNGTRTPIWIADFVDGLADLERDLAAAEQKADDRFQPSLVKIGRLVYLLASKHVENEFDVLQLLETFEFVNDANGYIELERARRALAVSDDPFAKVRLVWAGRWFACGLPQVRLEPALASSLIFTDLPDDVLPDVRAPWKSFRVAIPANVIPSPHADNAYMTDVCVQASESLDEQTWSFFAVDTCGEYTYLNRTSLRDLAVAWTPEDEKELTGRERRVTEILGRLIIGICAFANQECALDRVGAKRKKGESKWRLSKLPIAADYVLGRDIKLRADLSPAVGNYVLGASRRMKLVQWPVRGHWRNQAHGPERALRKRIWVQPYWKGQDEGAMLVRAHELVGPRERTPNT